MNDQKQEEQKLSVRITKKETSPGFFVVDTQVTLNGKKLETVQQLDISLNAENGVFVTIGLAVDSAQIDVSGIEEEVSFPIVQRCETGRWKSDRPNPSAMPQTKEENQFGPSPLMKILKVMDGRLVTRREAFSVTTGSEPKIRPISKSVPDLSGMVVHSIEDPCGVVLNSLVAEAHARFHEMELKEDLKRETAIYSFILPNAPTVVGLKPEKIWGKHFYDVVRSVRECVILMNRDVNSEIKVPELEQMPEIIGCKNLYIPDSVAYAFSARRLVFSKNVYQRYLKTLYALIVENSVKVMLGTIEEEVREACSKSIFVGNDECDEPAIR